MPGRDGIVFIVNVEVVVQKGREYLLTLRSMKEEIAPGMLSFPGGKVEVTDPRDVLEKTAARELAEETGISAGDYTYVASKLFKTPAGRHVLNIILAARYSSGSASVRDSDELDSVFWLSEQALLENPDLPAWTRETFSLAKDRVFGRRRGWLS